MAAINVSLLTIEVSLTKKLAILMQQMVSDYPYEIAWPAAK
jgi:hypothetical protein